MADKKEKFKIYGKVLEKESGKGIPELTVKAIDRDLFFDDLLGAVTTDEKGNFEIRYDKEDFRELFFDKKPDIYLKIKNPDGEVIHTTEDKVRYGADETEEFIVIISGNLLVKEAKMKWDIKKSDEIKERIAKDEKLMTELSNSVDEVLKKYGIELKGVSYVFEPRVFSMAPDEAPEIMMKSREAMVTAIIEDLHKKEPMADRVLDEAKYLKVMKCIPQCGGMDPLTLRVLEKYRINKKIFEDDPVPIINSGDFIKRIVGNENLLRDFSETVFGVIKTNGISFAENEGCVFTPYVFETPIFAQKVGVADSVKQIRGFGPQIYADPTPEPAAEMSIRVFPGIIDTPQWRTVGVICHPWWWIGIPSPEMLFALDVMRGVGKG